MWDVIHRWLPILCWIGGLTIILPGVILGVYQSVKQVFGDVFSQRFRYKREMAWVSEWLFWGGWFSLLGGYVGIILHHYGHASETTIIYGLSLWGFFGFSYRILDVDRLYRRFIGWMKMNSLLGGIIGGVVGVGYCWSCMNHPTFGTSEWPWPIQDVTDQLVGTLAGGISSTIAGAFLGGYSPFVILMVPPLVAFAVGSLTAILPYGIGVGVAMGFFAIIGGGVIGRMAHWIFPTTTVFSRKLFNLMTPLVSLIRFRLSLCEGCLRYTEPFKSEYENGIRYCEHCHKPVDPAIVLKKLIFTFGTIPGGGLNPLMNNRRTPNCLNIRQFHEHPMLRQRI